MSFNFLNQLSIRRRLLLLTTLTSGIGVLLGCAGYLVYDFREDRRQKVEELQSLADFVGTNAVAALAFDDSAGGAKLLAALRTRPHIRMGVLYRADRSFFASYIRADLNGKVKIPLAQPVGVIWGEEGLTLASSVFLDQRQIGSLYMDKDLTDVHERLRHSVQLIGFFGCASLLVVYFLTPTLQHSVTGQMPVVSGIDTTSAIREWEHGRRRTPIIAMTAHAMVGDADRFLAAGMDGYVSNPIQPNILRAEIDRLTQSKITNEGERMTNQTAANDTNPSPASMVNLPELLTRVENDRELLCDLLSIFKEEFPGYRASLEKAVDRKDAAEIANLSHTLKGMLSNLAVAKASASAARLEQLARSGETASLRDAYAAFKRDVHGLLPEMESYMAEARA